MAVRRLAAAVDSFLLKFTIEELLGWPMQLISGGLLDGIESALNLTGAASKYEALAGGEAHIYPEARAHCSLSVTAADSISVSGQVRVDEPRFGLESAALRFGCRTSRRNTSSMCAKPTEYGLHPLLRVSPHVVLWMCSQLLLFVLA
jgi:hypothetical protein